MSYIMITIKEILINTVVETREFTHESDYFENLIDMYANELRTFTHSYIDLLASTTLIFDTARYRIVFLSQLKGADESANVAIAKRAYGLYNDFIKGGDKCD